MSVALYAFTCGSLTVPRHFLLARAEGLITVPIPSYLIVHPKGKALFDSGLNLQAQDDPLGYIGEEGLKFNRFHFRPGEEIGARLKSMDLAPGDITHLINSHLHYDHAGGNAQIPNAAIVVQRIEWEYATSRPDTDLAYLKKDFLTGQDVQEVMGEHDVFGDGSVVCLPTYGHTPGHQSLRVRAGGQEFVLCGDACYLRESLENLHTPGVIADKAAALAVLKRFREMQARGSRIMFGHDPEFWKTIPQAPTRLG